MKKVLTMVVILAIALFLVNGFVSAVETNNDEGKLIVLSNSTDNTVNGFNSSVNNNIESNQNYNQNNSVFGNNNNTTSIYNNSDLPTTGLTSSAPIIVFIGLSIISAIYSLKKMSDYKANI